MRTGVFVLLACSAAALPQTAHRHHPPASAEEYARLLNDPKRDAWQHPDKVVEALGIGKTEVIADIGAGTGYFARRFAPHAAKVFAVDINEDLLMKAAEGAPSNLEIIVGALDDPKLQESSVDTIFFCDVLHHIEDRPAYYQKLAKALKPGGRLVVIDFHKKPLPVGPPEKMKLSESQVIAELKAAGFAKTRTFNFLPHQYFLVFNKFSVN